MGLSARGSLGAWQTGSETASAQTTPSLSASGRQAVIGCSSYTTSRSVIKTSKFEAKSATAKEL